MESSPGKSREAGEAAACVTGMKGTLKLNSVAEEEKSKLVPDEEADAPPPLAFLSAMAADPRPLRGSASPVLHTDRKPVHSVKMSSRGRLPSIISCLSLPEYWWSIPTHILITSVFSLQPHH